PPAAVVPGRGQCSGIALRMMRCRCARPCSPLFTCFYRLLPPTQARAEPSSVESERGEDHRPGGSPALWRTPPCCLASPAAQPVAGLASPRWPRRARTGIPRKSTGPPAVTVSSRRAYGDCPQRGADSIATAEKPLQFLLHLDG